MTWLYLLPDAVPGPMTPASSASPSGPGRAGSISASPLPCPDIELLAMSSGKHAAATLVARMEDKALDQAVIWDDIATFDGTPWRSAVDILSAGYPCQPFSVAGKRRGADDPRHLWPHVARIIGECEPPFVFLENVAHHLRLGFPEVASGLVGMGLPCGRIVYGGGSRRAPSPGTALHPRHPGRRRTGRPHAPALAPVRAA